MTHSESGAEYSAPVAAPETPELDEAFEALLRFLRDKRGFDFHGYKRTSLMRRVRHRMDQLHVDSFTDYMDMLEVDSEEFNALFNTILINVTSFFRDVDAWDVIRDEIIPTILAERGPSMRSGCGARGARQVRRHIHSRCCSPKRWVSNLSGTG